MSSIDETGKINNDKLKENLIKIENITGVPLKIEDSSYPLNITVDNKKVEIKKDGPATVIDTSLSTPQKQITFYLITNKGTKEYTVEESTIWEEFIKNQNPCDEGGELFRNPPDITNEGSFGIISYLPAGVLQVWLGGPVFEGENIDDALWVYPTDAIKSGCYYNVVR